MRAACSMRARIFSTSPQVCRNWIWLYLQKQSALDYTLMNPFRKHERVCTVVRNHAIELSDARALRTIVAHRSAPNNDMNEGRTVGWSECSTTLHISTNTRVAAGRYILCGFIGFKVTFRLTSGWRICGYVCVNARREVLFNWCV